MSRPRDRAVSGPFVRGRLIGVGVYDPKSFAGGRGEARSLYVPDLSFKVLGGYALCAWSPWIQCGKPGVGLQIDDDFEPIVRLL